MRHPDLSRAHWRKSSRSSANGQCVEVADLGEVVATRDSKDPHGPVLLFSRFAWNRFLRTVGHRHLAVIDQDRLGDVGRFDRRKALPSEPSVTANQPANVHCSRGGGAGRLPDVVWTNSSLQLRLNPS